MLRLILALVLLASAGASAPEASAQSPLAWSELPASPFHGYRSEDVAVVGDRVWAVNGSGQAWRSDDRGETWAQTFTDPFSYFRATVFPTASTGWIGVLFNTTARLYETHDGGATYANVTSRIQPAVPGGICGMWALDEQTVWAVGQYSTPAYVVKTTDGGATWTSTALAPLADALIDVRFFDALHGLASGAVGPYSDSRARIIGTDDGGATWTVRHTVTDLHSVAWKLTFPTRLVGYASIETFGGEPDARILRTVDGGQTWTEMTIPGGGSLQGLGFATPDVGWASGRGRTSVTTDGGLTWAALPTTQQGGQLDGDVNRFRFVGDSLAYAAGHKIYRLRGRFPTAGPETATDAPLEDGLAGVFPNPARGPVTIAYRTATASPVRIDVLDAQGRTVATLVDAGVAPGEHVATWAAGVAPGVYVVRMRAAGGVSTIRVAVAGR